MRNFILPIISVVCLFASCQHNEPAIQEPVPVAPVTLTASIENTGTKTTIDLASGKVSWVTGDAIYVNGAVFTATPDAADPSKATFSLESGTLTSGTFNAYYPSSIVDGGVPTLPKTISYDPDGFDMPMYAVSETSSLQFKNICGVFVITVKNTQFSSVSSITISSDNLAMSGPFSVSESRAVLEHPNTTYNDVTLSCSQPVTVTGAGTPFYIPVPAATYSRIRICVTGKGTDGSDTSLYMATRANTDITVARNALYPITFASNITIAKTKVANASNAEDTDDERH